MEIIFKDDGKQKHQSVTAAVDLTTFGSEGHTNVEIVSYGATQDEARANIMIRVADLIALLNK